MSKCIKGLLVFIIPSFFIVGCGNKSNEEEQTSAIDLANKQMLYTKPADATYEVKSGIVTFENAIMQGMNQVFYFDEHGKKEARYTVMEMEIMGQKISTGNVEIHIDSFLIQYDLQSKEGTKVISHTSIGGAKEIPKDFSKLTPEFIKDYQLKELGNKEVLGKECKGYEVTVMGIKTEFWIWEGIVLYSRIFLTKDGNPMELKASKLEVDVSIPADKFQVPPEISITSIGIKE
jgi:outer membrane lipoprotein-sorting protein